MAIFFPCSGRVFSVAVLVSIVFAGAVHAADADAPASGGKTKILFIGKAPDHPFGSHMYLHTCGVLAKCVELTPGVQAVVSDGWPADAKTLDGVTCIVVYTNPGAELLLDSPHRAEFEAMMHQGVGLATLHWASSVLKEDDDRLGKTWLAYTGATWISNVGLSYGPSPLVRLIPEHPICNGWKQFEIDDEYYLSPTTASAKPLLQVREKGGKDVAVGWVWERPDGGRSFVTTLGHSYKYFQQDDFRRMIVNGILWAAKVEIPKDGAPVNLPPQSLALPPQPAKP